MWRDHGADVRGATLTRIGSTELITPEMRGCGCKGSCNHPGNERVWGDHGADLHRIYRTDNPGNERVGGDHDADLHRIYIGSTELITPGMRGC